MSEKATLPVSQETASQAATSAGWLSFSERAHDGALLPGAHFPTRKEEAWHYTSLQMLGRTAWKEPCPMALQKARAFLDRLELPEAQGLIVFGNGFEVPELTRLPQGVRRLSSTSSRSDSSLPVDMQNCFSEQLNAALCQEGLRLQVPENQDAGLIIMVSLHDGADMSTHLRHEFLLEKDAALQVLEIATGVGHYLANPVTRVTCSAGARCLHVKQQAESPQAVHLALLGSMVEEGAVYDGFTLNQGSELGRHEVRGVLAGAHAHTQVNALQVVGGDRLNDLTSRIRHQAPDCTSRQTVRSVLDEKGVGVFQGQILVERAAQKTDGEQLNQALLLSEEAQINSKPELRIFADDVKCSHGATVGALDEDQLFFLRARGIAESQARAMLVEAFLEESLALVKETELRAYLTRCLRASLPGAGAPACRLEEEG
ncbi:Fe-S cluster assembly protein SufD [Oecophyllibacter saccharovorans]|uniref:Fe-S cluster assembly protein SufD n=1 Tax=Oecophyllibacter saccharovorans TaxID=2558360 RepID=A0A506UQY1_9PROT|nr:Fe-S cluster assembly protein SufD [Oecophyllibacter saccharovorans]TPW35767.1 Fe-S cluster assembly protein SufD [Oecophyllibacter saccharovorans]